MVDDPKLVREQVAAAIAERLKGVRTVEGVDPETRAAIGAAIEDFKRKVAALGGAAPFEDGGETLAGLVPPALRETLARFARDAEDDDA